MGCIFAILAVLTPRFGLFLLWMFSDLISRAFDGIVIPLLGFIFLPFTTIIYVLVYNPISGLEGLDWLWILLAFLVEISAYAGSSIANKERFSKEYDDKPTDDEKEEAEDAEEDEDEDQEIEE